MQKVKLTSFIFIFIFMIMFTLNSEFVAASGFDFQTDDYDESFYVPLDGEWYFFEKELLTPVEINERLISNEGKVVELPGSFQMHTGEVNDYGTYATIVQINDTYVDNLLAIHIPYQYSAYKLFVDQDELAFNGVVGKDGATHEAEMSPRKTYFIPRTNELLLTMQVSSFEHIRGGFENTIFLGDAKTIDDKVHANAIIHTFINGFIFIIGLFMILFSIYRRIDTLFLIFGLFTMIISIRSFFTVPFYYTILFPNMSWLWGTRLEYLLSILASLFYVLLMWKWYEHIFSKKFLNFLVIVQLAVIVIVFVTKPVFFQAVYFKVFYLAIPIFLYFLYIIYKSLKENHAYAKVNLLGLFIIFIAFLNDFAIGQDLYKSWNLMLPAVAIYVIIHVVTMSRNFAKSVKQLEVQNIQLTALNESNEILTGQLQEEIKRKDQFLANTSHELRNPLHGIINIAHALLQNNQEKLDETTKENLRLQLTIGHHMARTLDDLLDITRIKEQRIKLTLRRQNVKSVVIAVVDMFRYLIENKNIHIKVDIADNLPDVAADSNRLIQILFNLIHNAVKYTNEGTITIHAYNEKNFVYIAVQDTGIGMTSETLEKVFSPYVQANSDVTESGSGIGLGLSICKNLVELHGGTIEARSAYGKGSTFTFSLPLADLISVDEAQDVEGITVDELNMLSFDIDNNILRDASYKTPDITKLFIDQSSSYNPRILIVDDDAVNLRVITNILSYRKFVITTVTNGDEALKEVEKSDWDLIISDVMMPKMSGYELTQIIREKYSISELPIILLTARSNPEDIYTGFLVGANDYVTKPVDATELIVRVQALTNLQLSIRERLDMEAAWLQAQIRPHFLLNTLNAIVSLSHIDIERMNKLIENFVQYLQRSFYFKSSERLIPLEDELQLVKAYVYISKVRFDERINVKWELDVVDGVMVPPLSLQTLVENAFQHGVLMKSKGGTVIIRTRSVASGVEISVIDDGVGMDEEEVKEVFTLVPDRKRGIGLINTEQRLHRMFGTQLSVKSEANKGSTFSFIVPYLEATNEKIEA